MRYTKTVLYLLLMVLGLILGYNYLIAPIMMQNVGMGMGMHMRMYSSTSYIIDVRIIFVIVIVIALLLILELIKPGSKKNRCPKCSTVIEDEKWKICPNCGYQLNNRKD